MKRNWISTPVLLLTTTLIPLGAAEADEILDRIAQSSCALVLDQSGEDVLRERIQNGERAPEITVYERYKTLIAQSAEAKNLLPPSLVAQLLADSEQIVFHQSLKGIVDELLEGRLGSFTDAEVKASLTRVLKYRVPEDTLDARVAALQDFRKNGLQAGVPFAQSLSRLRYAMGELSLGELQKLVHGGDPLHPTPESLVGMYLRDTGAASVIRTFRRAPNSASSGPERLVVAISEESLQTYRKYFVRPEFLIHVHTPNQGTLKLSHNGRVGTYANMLAGDFRTPTEGSLLPHVLLKTSEAQRANQFFELGSHGTEDVQWPWNLPGYCATGGYNSCTHWVGNIPVGDELVTSYKFPGKVDQYAYNAVPSGPQIRELAPYDYQGVGNHQWYYATEEQRRRYVNLLHRVWKAPGHMQLSELLGPEELQAALRGEYANPGYVAYRLLGNISNDRMPLVFYVVQDHRAAIPQTFDPQIHAY